MHVGKQPFASIIMPAYNAAPCVGRAIDNCPAQSLPAWPLIVVDDGNTDTTADIVSGFHDDRIELIRTSGGNGPGGASNLALDRAIGRYLVPLDADDAFHPDRLRILSRCVESVTADTILVDRSIRSSEEPFPIPEPPPSPAVHAVPTDQLIIGSPPCKPLIPTALVSRTQARYPTGAVAAEDYAFIVLLLDGGGRLAQVDACMYWHRLRAGSPTRSSAATIRDARASVLDALRQQRSDPLVIESLEARQTRIDHLYAMSEIVEDLRDRRIGRVIRRLRQRPDLIRPTMQRLMTVLRYRIGRGKLARGTS